MEVVLLMIVMVIAGVGQSFFCKLFTDSYVGDKELSSVVFTSIFGVFIGFCTWIIGGFQIEASFATWVLGLITACILFLFNKAMIRANQLGPFSLLMLCVLFGGIILPALSGTLLYDEKMTTLQVCAILLMLVSFVIINYKGINLKKVPKVYYIWCGTLFMTNGLFGSFMNAQQKIMQATEREQMITITYITCAIMAVTYHFMIRRKKIIVDYKMGKNAIIFALISCLSAAISINLIMYLITKLASTIVFTISNGGVLSLSVICACVFLKEHLSKNQIVGICLSVIGIIMFSI